MTFVRLCLAIPVALIALSSSASATILYFDIFDPAYSGSENYPEGYGINQLYGDRVTSASMISGTSTFEYGVGAEGFTPNVVVEYGPFSIQTGGPSLWRYDYGDLTRILYQGSTDTGVPINYDYLTVQFTADPGYEVELYGFDLGGWFQSDYTVAEVAVYDAQYNGFFPNDNKVFSELDAFVAGAGPDHTSYSFATPLRGNIITIFIDARNLGNESELIGIDNIQFGQVIDATPVPEPSSVLLFSIGLVGMAGMRVGARRRRQSEQ